MVSGMMTGISVSLTETCLLVRLPPQHRLEQVVPWHHSEVGEVDATEIVW